MSDFSKHDLIEIVAAPITWLFIIYLVENIFIVKFYKYWNAGASFSLWKVFCCILLSIVLFVLTFAAFSLLSGNSYRKSQIDASPIAELTSEQIERLESVIERLKDFDFITQYEIEEKGEYTDPSVRKEYRLVWLRKEPYSLLLISIGFYYDEQCVIDNMQLAIRTNDRHKRPYTLIVNDNNTEAILGHSRMNRSAGTFYFPRSERHMGGGLRLGNAWIGLSESQEYYNLGKNISNEFIKLLCELLQEEEIVEV